MEENSWEIETYLKAVSENPDCQKYPYCDCEIYAQCEFRLENQR